MPGKDGGTSWGCVIQQRAAGPPPIQCAQLAAATPSQAPGRCQPPCSRSQGQPGCPGEGSGAAVHPSPRGQGVGSRRPLKDTWWGAEGVMSGRRAESSSDPGHRRARTLGRGRGGSVASLPLLPAPLLGAWFSLLFLPSPPLCLPPLPSPPSPSQPFPPLLCISKDQSVS